MNSLARTSKFFLFISTTVLCLSACKKDSEKIPEVETTSISSPTISQTGTLSVTIFGNVKNDKGYDITDRGIYWGENTAPSSSDNISVNGSGEGNFSVILSNLSPQKTYYVRAFATNKKGKGYGTVLSFTTPAAAQYFVGKEYQGGVIAYLFQNGDSKFVAGETHGIIATVSDLSTSAKWHSGTDLNTNATAVALGEGETNTNKITVEQGNGSYAAKNCSDLVLNGYSDWFLPSKEELKQIYIYKSDIKGFTSDYYWTSSEVNVTQAWRINFSNGTIEGNNKSSSHKVRPVRYF